ncbi:MAG: family 1 glycosylhydrolase [Clostridia bacterium]|nr:family 1 glycosylhydrolase [Clostridia bacterium]
MSKFLIGAATAPHQVEGNNIHSDYWVQEHLTCSPFMEPSGITCDHYNRYEEDIKLLAEAGLNAYRFGIEWARIQPERDKWDESEIEHYRKVLLCCKKYGVEPIVTLHHFTSPKWVISLGGWESEEVIEHFAKYSKKVVEELGELMTYVCTINEANMGLQLAAIAKDIMKMIMSGVQVGINFNANMEERKKYAEAEKQAFGCDKANVFVSERTEKGDEIVIRAHMAAKAAIKSVRPELKVGITLSLHDFQAVDGGEENVAKEWDMEFAHYLPFIQDDDFLGVQNYTRKIIGKEGNIKPSKEARLTQMGYEDYPQGIGNVLRKVAKDFKNEILVTENGIATEDDGRRIEFIKEAVDGVLKAKAAGIPVNGYIHWTLMDNYEWQKGFGPKFGLIEIDRKTMDRKPKASLKYLGSIKVK